MNNTTAANLSLIWGNLRNYNGIEPLGINTEIKLTNKVIGLFPIDSHNPIYLEIPKNNKKSNLIGRKNRVIRKEFFKNIWDPNRIIHLPNYEINYTDINLDILRLMFFQWSDSLVPEEIPCIAISYGINGFYSEIRMGQLITVLLVWHDLTGRILELDWYEGGEDDCISPEWYIKSSKLFPIHNILKKFLNICKTSPPLDKPFFTIQLNPYCLGNCLKRGKITDYTQPWHYEWIYYNQNDLINDLELIEGKLSEIFDK